MWQIPHRTGQNRPIPVSIPLDEEGELENAGIGLDLSDVQSVAHRQLAASLVVAVVIAAAAVGMTALKPAHRDTADLAPQRSAMVQQPSFVTPPGQRVAAKARHRIELP
jgi:hypothetical protein